MDITKLTKEQKLQYLDVLAERKRRILEKKPTYKPNAGQLPVHLDDKPIRVVAAANGGGKTACAAQEMIWFATGFNPLTKKFTKVPATIILLLDSPSKVDEVWLTELRKWYPIDTECVMEKQGKPYYSKITFKNGSKVLIMFHEQDDMVFEGIQIDYLIADEPFPRRIWIALTRGARKKGSAPRFLIIGTPIGQPWLYNDLWKKAASGERTDIGLHRFSITVNESNLADGYIEQFSRNLTDHEKQVRLHGQFAHLEGLALAHLFDREKHLVDPFEWPRGKPVAIIIDPHMSKPHTCLMIGATGDGRIYALKEMKSKSPARQFAQELKAFAEGPWGIIEWKIDSLGETANTGGDGNKSFAQVLRDNGVPVRSTSYDDKDDEAFIVNIQDVLEVPTVQDNFGRCVPKLSIIRTCTALIDDIESVQWTKHRNQDGFKPKLEISNKDYLSCLKYGLKTNIGYVADAGHMPKVKRSRRSAWSGGLGRSR